MNAGIADAADLAWMLAAVLQGWADQAILDAYEARDDEEREQHLSAHARLLRRSLDKLDPAAWRAFLTKLVEKIVVQPAGLELHLVLPAQVRSQRSNQASRSSSTLVRAEIGSFSSSW